MKVWEGHRTMGVACEGMGGACGHERGMGGHERGIGGGGGALEEYSTMGACVHIT